MKRPVLRYHGGKWKLARWIIGHFPKHRIYVEPYGGAASVLMQKARCYSEVYNDQWEIVVNVFQVLRNPILAKELERLIRITPYARSEFEDCGDAEIANIPDPVERARRTIFRSFAGFGSAATNAKHAIGFRANANRNGTTPAHDWANYPTHIHTFTERLKGIVIENKPAIDVILQHDSPETLYYIDPPYPKSTRNMKRGNAAYAHDMTDEDHRTLARYLNKVRGMVVLSGYRCSLYDELYAGWGRVEKCTFADGAQARTEILWINKAVGQQLNLF